VVILINEQHQGELF